MPPQGVRSLFPINDFRKVNNPSHVQIFPSKVDFSITADVFVNPLIRSVIAALFRFWLPSPIPSGKCKKHGCILAEHKILYLWNTDAAYIAEILSSTPMNRHSSPHAKVDIVNHRHEAGNQGVFMKKSGGRLTDGGGEFREVSVELRLVHDDVLPVFAPPREESGVFPSVNCAKGYSGPFGRFNGRYICGFCCAGHWIALYFFCCLWYFWYRSCLWGCQFSDEKADADSNHDTGDIRAD
jgi:hypothetical protein